MSDSTEDARERRRLATAALWARLAATQSDAELARLREEIVLLNMPIATSIANRYASRGIPLEDLEQVACLGLVKAVTRFDPGFRRDFASFAVPTISGEVKRHFRDLGWAVRPPRRVQEMQARVNAATSASVQALGRAAQPREIAEQLGVDPGTVVEAMALSGAFTPASLDRPVGEPGHSTSLGEFLVSDRDDYEEVENAMILRQAMSTLAPRDRLVLQRRFHDGLTQEQIGNEIGLSQMQVSRLLGRILAALRALVDHDRTLTA